MNAKEARELAYRTNTDETRSQYANIKKKIAEEAKNGQYYMWWYESFNDDVRTKLVEEGYSVGNTTHEQRDGTMTKISWN